VITVTSGITLSNIDTVKTTHTQTSTLTGGLAGNVINVSGTTLSNVANVKVTDTIYTNSINTHSGSNINLNGKTITNLDALFINSNLNIAGEFFVTTMTTCNADRFEINNDGSGPAFTVNQQSGFGNGTVASFMSDNTIALGVNGSRQVIIGGNFGSTVPSSTSVDAQLYVEALSADTRDGLYVKQNSTTYDVARFDTATGIGGGGSNVVIDSHGRMGFGVDNPTARLHVVHDDDVTTPLMKMSTSANTNAVVVTADGHMGIGVAASTGTSTLSVADFVEAKGFIAHSGSSELDFNQMDTSNVKVLKVNSGTATVPTITFNTDTNTGIFNPVADNLALTTAGSERMRVMADGKVGINTTAPLVQLDIVSTDAIRIPVGTSAQRPSNSNAGFIRYNSTISSFEGFGPGNAWGSLGGVKDVAQTTYISAEASPGSHDCNIRFFTNGVESMRLSSNANLGVGVADPAYKLEVSTDALIPTLYTNTFSTLAASSNIDVSTKNLSNINYAVSTVVDTQELKARVNSGVIMASNISLSNMLSVDTANIKATMTGGLINMNGTTLSNINNAKIVTADITTTNATTVNVSTLKSPTTGGYINLANSSLSNLSNVSTACLTSATGVIDLKTTTLSNAFHVDTDKLTTRTIESPTDQLSMSWARILDVDSIVVRSNITFLLEGTNTISNLPTDVVRINAATGKILDEYISSNMVRLAANGQINPAMIPGLSTSDRASFVKSMDKVGIGLRNPAQKLHVNGHQVITGGKLGIGTTVPVSSLYIVDDNASLGYQSVRIESRGTTDAFALYGGCNATWPSLYVNASCNIGVGTSAPQYRLHTVGTGRFDTVRTNKLVADAAGTIDCGYTYMSNVWKADIDTATIRELTVTNLNVPSSVSLTDTYTDTLQTNTITSENAHINMNVALNITNYDESLYVAQSGGTTETKIGLSVSEYILSKAALTISDRRAKENIVDTVPSADLASLASLDVKRFTYIDDRSQAPQAVPGFLAQDVEAVAPYAVRTIVAPIPNIMEYATVTESTSAVTGLSEEKIAILAVGDSVKVLVDDESSIAKIASIDTSAGIVTFTLPLNAATGKSVLVYGTVVNDFKVLENERLIPLAFNAIKELHSKVTAQQATIDSILERLSALEG
jgi:hypothetical protein